MGSKELLCYLFYFADRTLVSAISNVHIGGYLNQWLGLSIGNNHYKLTVEESNEFLNKWLKD